MEGGAEAAQVLLAQGCTAIICGSDIMAVGVIESARGQGLRVPEDVSVIGHDDSLLMAYTDPPLTTLAQDYEAIGQTAVSLLLDEIAGRPAARAEMTFRRPLTVRASTGPAPRPRPGTKPESGPG